MIDVTDQTFQADVIERSVQIPVVVDLWAPWCGPCKTLGPLLEKVVGEAAGKGPEPKVILAKVNVDENPGASQAFKVQSIPAVFALSGGQIVDGFTGAQPESVIREFVDRLVPSGEDAGTAALLTRGDEASLVQVLEAVPDHPVAVPALAQIMVGDGRNQEALELLGRIPETEETLPMAALARSNLAGGSQNIEAERQLEDLLPKVKADDEARQQFVDLLEILGPGHPNTAGWRKKLTATLF